MSGGEALHRDRGRALSFGADAERYHRARPRYPAELREALLADGPSAVLDVGCGTGIVAELLARSGVALLGVEPDPAMAAVARRGGLEVEEATFEAWEARGRTFDLVTAGQAWHWVDPDAGARRAHEVLRPGGRFAAFWNYGTPEPAALRALQAVYERHGLAVDRHSVVLGGGSTERLDDTAAAVERAGFSEAAIRSWAREEHVAADAWIDALPTHSDHAALADDVLAALLADLRGALDALGGAFAMRWETWLVTARR